LREKLHKMIEAKNLYKSFGSNEVLKGINVKVKTGEIVVIIGASGSGKSTFLRCLNYLETPTKGQIILDDISVDAEKHQKKQVIALRRETAMVFQLFNLFKNKTALENIMEGLTIVRKMDKAQAKEKSISLLERVGLADRMMYYPHQLSGGQQQRVAIARALAIDPKVVLFDEPTSALDPEMVGEVLNVIKEVVKTRRTLIIVTHEMAFAREIADRILFFDGGIILEEGTPEQIFLKPQQQRTQQFLQRVSRRI
jgi:L-cystine transport system ATP-binding protein